MNHPFRTLIVATIVSFSCITTAMKTTTKVITNEDKQVITQIRKLGFDPQKPETPLTIYHIAARLNNISVLKYLFKNFPGQNPNPEIISGHYQGLTPLHFAGNAGNVSIFELYRRNYPTMHLNPPVKQGKLKELTPLCFAAYQGHIGLFEWFRKNAPEMIEPQE